MYNDDGPIRIRKSRNKKKRSFFNVDISTPSKRKMNLTEKTLSKAITLDTLISVLIIIAGLFFYIDNEVNDNIMAIWIAGIMLVYGLIRLYTCFQRKKLDLYRYDIIYASFSVLIGVVTLLTKNITLTTGIWFLILSISKGVLAVQFKEKEEKGFLFVIVSALLNAFLGIVVMINPFTNLVLRETVGSFLILYGLLHATVTYLVYQRSAHLV